MRGAGRRSSRVWLELSNSPHLHGNDCCIKYCGNSYIHSIRQLLRLQASHGAWMRIDMERIRVDYERRICKRIQANVSSRSGDTETGLGQTLGTIRS